MGFFRAFLKSYQQSAGLPLFSLFSALRLLFRPLAAPFPLSFPYPLHISVSAGWAGLLLCVFLGLVFGFFECFFWFLGLGFLGLVWCVFVLLLGCGCRGWCSGCFLYIFCFFVDF
jgi:hypothetical protein